MELVSVMAEAVTLADLSEEDGQARTCHPDGSRDAW